MALFGRKDRDVGTLLAEVRAAELAEEVHTVDEVRRKMSRGERLEFGGPTRCPNCGMLGFVESVNHLRGNCFNFCHTCRNRWVVTSRAIELSLQYEVEGERDRRDTGANPWTRDGFIELEEDLSIEVTDALRNDPDGPRT